MPNRLNAVYDRELCVVGIEYEFLNSQRDARSFIERLRHKLPNWNLVHDASCEGSLQTLRDIPVTFSSAEKRETFTNQTYLPFSTLGGEVTSPILLEKEIQSNVDRLCEFFIDEGEYLDKRSSLHVHCNVGNSIPLYALRNILKMVIAIESFLYRVGGMGDINRGIYNHFIFQRPYCEYGPPVVRYENKNYPIFLIKQLLESENKQDFFSKYGDSIYLINNDAKYVTQRYMGTNFYSILKRESIEFRYANTVLRPDFIMAWITFLRALVKKSFTSLEEFFEEPRPLNYKMSVREVFHMLDLFDISNTDKCTLYGIWEESGDLSDFRLVPVYSHLDNPSTFRYGFPFDPYPSNLKIFNTEKINIHTLERETALLYEKSRGKLERINMQDHRLNQMLFEQGGRQGPRIEYKIKMDDMHVHGDWVINNNLAPQVIEDIDLEELDDDELEFVLEDDAIGLDDEDCFDYLTQDEIRPLPIKNRNNPTVSNSIENTGERMMFMPNICGLYKLNDRVFFLAEIAVPAMNGFIYEYSEERFGNTRHGFRVSYRQPSLSFKSLYSQLTMVS